MDTFLGIAGYSVSAIGFLFLFLLLLTTKQTSLQKTVLLLSSLFGVLWGASIAYQIYSEQPFVQFLAAETLRNFGWFLLIISALTDKQSLTKAITSNPIASSITVLMVLTAILELAYPWILWLKLNHVITLHLAQSVAGLWLIEQLFRRTDKHSKWAIKPLCLGLGIIFAYNFALYADGLLTSSLDPGFWYGQGWVAILTPPLILISARRVRQWSTRIYVSRDVVYHSTLLLVAGAYLLLMALAGYYIKFVGDSWGSMAQNIFFALSGLILASLFLSEVLRRKLKVFITKHFYANKYEYREEWMKFASILEENAEESPYQISLNAMIRPFGCEHGMLVTLEGGSFKKHAFYNLTPDYEDSDEILQTLIESAIEHRWIIDIDELKGETSKAPFEYNKESISQLKTFSYIIPITNEGGIKSACLISEPQLSHSINWEDRDLMGAISKQLSVYLNLYQTNQTLTENQQFDTFNRMSAFLAHDLKNILAQLQLLSKNAKKHKDNPEFIDDAFETIDSAVVRLNKVVDHLRKKNIETKPNEAFDIQPIIRQVCKNRAVSLPVPEYNNNYNESITLTTDKERFTNVISHIIQNAQEATADDGSVTVTITGSERYHIISIEDNGTGMSQDFVENRLFKPFDTTKGNSGMGIGAYDAKKLIEQLNGYIDVQTDLGKGTCFNLYIPVDS